MKEQSPRARQRTKWAALDLPPIETINNRNLFLFSTEFSEAQSSSSSTSSDNFMTSVQYFPKFDGTMLSEEYQSSCTISMPWNDPQVTALPG